MSGRSIAAFALLAMVALPASAADRTPADPRLEPVLAKADVRAIQVAVATGLPSVTAATEAPAPKRRAARVTSCRCGDQAGTPTQTAEVEAQR